MDRLDVYSDVICPWCFIGKRRMEQGLALLAQEGLAFQVGWRPFQLNPDMPPQGLPRDVYRRAKFGSLTRSRQLDRQVAEAGRQVGIEFRFHRIQMTPNTMGAHRLIRWAGERDRQDAVVETLFRAYFCEGRDIGDRDVLLDSAASAGLDRAESEAYLASDAGFAEVAREDEAARQAGLNGVPAFALDNHILFSGAVPADVFAEAVAKARRVLREQAA